MFEKELEYYKENKQDMLRHHENQFVVIKDKKFIGAFTTEQEAYEAGLKELGNVAFLIKRVTKEEEIIRFPALAIGIVNADT
jgi:hypothetical protein